MSKRPIEQKKRRRVAKLLRKQPLDAYFDLVQWLLDHDHARTKRAARTLILSKQVRANSHVLGVERQPVLKDGVVTIQEVVAPYVLAELKPDVVVLSA